VIVSMIDDPDDLIRVYPRVDRMQDAFTAGNTVVQLEMAVAVPRQRTHAIVHLEPQCVERIRALHRAAVRLCVAAAVQITFDPARHDPGIAVIAGSKLQQAGNQQRMVLHQAAHRCLLCTGPME
jgi:hypothetical protein